MYYRTGIVAEAKFLTPYNSRALSLYANHRELMRPNELLDTKYTGLQQL